MYRWRRRDRWFGLSYEKCRECDAIEFHFTLPPNVTTHFSFGKDPDPSSDAPGTYLRLDVYYDETKSLPIVEQEFGTFVCLKCVSYIRPSSKKKNPERPPLSVAFRDFGLLFRPSAQITAPALPPLTYLERLAIAPARCYMQMYKISGSWVSKGYAPFFRGYSITFRAPKTLPRVMGAIMSIPRTDVHAFVTLEFVGPKEQSDRQMASKLPFGPLVCARFEVLMAYARCLNAVGYYERLFDKFGCVFEDSPKLSYFTDDRFTEGSLEWILYQNLKVEDDPAIIELEAFARRNDPSGALPQSAPHGETAPDFPPGVPIIYEDVHLDQEDGGAEPSDNVNRDFLRDCSDVLKSVTPVEPGSNVPVRVLVPRNPTPMNSWTDFADSLSASYPDSFPLGLGRK